MTMKRWDGVAFQDLATAKRWDGVAWVDLTIAKRWDGAAWIDIPLPGGGGGGLSATASAGSAEGSVFIPEPAPLVTTVFTNTSITVTATGGMGSGPTFSWARVSGDSAITATAPTSATTAFSANMGKNRELSATFRCTVTRGVEVVTVDVGVYLSYSTDI